MATTSTDQDLIPLPVTSEEHAAPTSSSRKRYRSPIWIFFEKLNGNKAKCGTCGMIYQHSSNTSNINI